MLWAAFDFPSLALDVFARAWPPQMHARPFVVDSGGHVPRIVALNDAARAAGLREQMLLSAAYALAPELVQQARDLPAEQAALAQLATFALGFTPTVSLVPPSAWVAEIGGSLRLFGGRAKLVARLVEGMQTRGFAARVGVAPTAIAALAFARAGQPAAVASIDALPPALDGIALVHFDLPEAARTTLAAAGVRTFGEADRLPREGLARRFGPSLVATLDRAAGRAARSARAVLAATAVRNAPRAARTRARRRGAELRRESPGAGAVGVAAGARLGRDRALACAFARTRAGPSSRFAVHASALRARLPRHARRST